MIVSDKTIIVLYYTYTYDTYYRKMLYYKKKVIFENLTFKSLHVRSCDSKVSKMPQIFDTIIVNTQVPTKILQNK